MRAAWRALAALALPLLAPSLSLAQEAPLDARKLELARAIASHGLLTVIGPLQTRAEVEAIIADHPDLSPEDQSTLRVIGEREAAILGEKAIAAEAEALARTLSLEDLTAIAAYETSEAAQHRRAAMPTVMGGVMTALAGTDYKGAVTAAFCQATGRLCPA